MSVHLGFVDAHERLYDLNFRTMKRRLRDADGTWDVEPDESLSHGVSIEAAMFLEAPRPHLLLRPTSGVAYTSDRRLLFLAGETVERSAEEPTAFNVAIHVPRTAVDHLLRDARGREVVEVRRDEMRGRLESRAELTVKIQAAWLGSGTANAALLLVLRPMPAAIEALAPLRL